MSEVITNEPNKTPPELQKKLEPNGYSSNGFLEKGQSLDAVIQRDKRALEILQYTNEEIIELLNQKLFSRKENFSFVTASGINVNVTRLSTLGEQYCPFDCKIDHVLEETNVQYNVKTPNMQRPKAIPGLIRHLIKDHSFFEGNTLYRVPPELVVELFGEERVPGSIEEAKKIKL